MISPSIHSHECENCDATVICCCANKASAVYCIECGELLEALLRELAERWGVEVAA